MSSFVAGVSAGFCGAATHPHIARTTAPADRIRFMVILPIAPVFASHSFPERRFGFSRNVFGRIVSLRLRTVSGTCQPLYPFGKGHRLPAAHSCPIFIARKKIAGTSAYVSSFNGYLCSEFRQVFSLVAAARSSLRQFRCRSNKASPHRRSEYHQSWT